MPSKRYRSAQMTRQVRHAAFVETTSKERRCNIMTLYQRLEDYFEQQRKKQRCLDTKFLLG